MPTLPDNPHIDHLKRQARDLLRAFRAGDPEAAGIIARTLPAAAAGRLDDMRLHDAQSCIARQYGFTSWRDLADAVEARNLARLGRADLVRRWLGLAYAGDLTATLLPARPHLAARLLQDTPDLRSDLAIACAAGDIDALASGTAPIGPFALPPLIAVTHSSLLRLPEFAEPLRRAARNLLAAGADPNVAVPNRFPGGNPTPLSALYGAVGVSRDGELTETLLAAGADPNDNESLYHSLEDPAITRLLLRHGARPAGTNAVRRALDMATPEALDLVLAYGGDPNEPASGPPTSTWGTPLLRAIALRKSLPFIDILLAAGADPAACTQDGVSASRLAQQVGRPDIAARLAAAGAADTLSDAEAFVAACARGDAAAARAIQAHRPDLPAALPPQTLRLLPDTVAWGDPAAARTMVALGWPIAARGGDWDATALNLAVFRGDAGMAAFLLDHGADWREPHGYGDDALGTLSWASVYAPDPSGDWPGCARALLAHGLPAATPDPADPDRVLIAGRKARFSEEVRDVLLSA